MGRAMLLAFRSILVVCAGMFVFMLVVAAVDYLGHSIFPPPAGVDFNDPNALRAMMENLPKGALVLLVVGWALGAVAGCWLAARTAPRARMAHGLVVGALIIAGTIMNFVLIPHPAWILAAAFVAVPAAILGGTWLGRRQRTSDPIAALGG